MQRCNESLIYERCTFYIAYMGYLWQRNRCHIIAACLRRCLGATNKKVVRFTPSGKAGFYAAKRLLIRYLEKDNSRAKAGDVLNARAFQHQHMLHWNPKQKAALDPTLQKMEAEGLIESTGDNVVLTQKGFDALY